MIGQLLGNRYEIIQKIGDGGMAVVYKAQCRVLKRPVAVKVLKPEFIDDDEFIEKFKNEAEAIGRLSHPNIVNIYDVGQDDKINYIVMEYVSGGNLKDIIKEKGKIDEARALDITEQIAMALSQAHKKGIIHRDIKPHNILISSDEIAKVADFGIAKASTSATMTNMGSVMGSVHYFSPEQARGGFIDERSDLYSLGIMLYEMVIGKLPFTGDTPVNIALKHISEEIKFSQENSFVSDDVQRIILKLTNKAQVDRYLNSEELIKDIRSIRINKAEQTQVIKSEEYEDFATQKMDFREALKLEKNKKREEGDDKKMARKKNKKKNTTNKKTTIIAISLAFFVSLALVVSAYFLMDVFMPTIYDVPKLENLSLDEANAKVNDMKVNVQISKETYSTSVEKDHIISQIPLAGSKIKKGETIKVEVSKGGQMVDVPDLMGEEINDADQILEDNNLKEGVITYEFSSKSDGTVLEQKPRAGTRVEEGTDIDLVVSKGKEEKLVKIPNLIGMSLEEARVNLNGVEIGDIRYTENKNKEEGIVLAQSLKPGQSYKMGTKIDLTVNKYSQQTIDKEENSNNKEENNDASKDEGKDTSKEENKDNPTPKNKQLSITLPQDKDNVKVVVKEKDGSSVNTVYSKDVNVKENGVNLTIPIQGTDKKDYEIYIDDSLYGNVTVDFQK